MKLLKYLLPIAVATCGFTASVMAADFATTKEARERDDEVLTDFVKTKRAITVQEKGGALNISGDVRAEYYHMRCWSGGHRRRGSGSKLVDRNRAERQNLFATNEFDIEANLMFDYRADRSWAAIQLQLSNSAGIKAEKFNAKLNNNKNFMTGSGTGDDLFLRKAYIGYNVAQRGTSRFDVEIGRRRGTDIFDSKIQFYNLFDGLLLKYANSWEGMTDFTAKAEAFVVDYNINHWAYVAELGFLNIADTGFDFKYSIIDWERQGANVDDKRHAKGNKFVNSQFTVGYTLSPDWIRWRTKLYGAYLVNTNAQRTHFTHHKRENNAWYVGMKVGDIRRAGDWAIDVDYEWVEPQAIPESDCSGICRDNPENVSFYNKRWGGFANYKGYMIDTFYALTDNLTINAEFERVHQATKHVGHKHRSYQLKLAAIYAF